jgi:excisionase family DNA binding protein
MNTRGPEVERQTLSVEQAAAVLGLSRGAAYLAARRGELPVLKIGRRLVVPKRALDALLNSAVPRPPAEPQA